jgi:hypothetical protein
LWHAEQACWVCPENSGEAKTGGMNVNMKASDRKANNARTDDAINLVKMMLPPTKNRWVTDRPQSGWLGFYRLAAEKDRGACVPQALRVVPGAWHPV